MDQTHLNFTLLGGAFFVGGLIWIGRSHFFWLRARKTPGKVVRVEARKRAGAGQDGDDAHYYCPTVRFEDDRGALRILSCKEETGIRYAVGDAVTILYDPRNPSNARIHSAKMLAVQGAAVAAGLAMLFFGLAT